MTDHPPTEDEPRQPAPAAPAEPTVTAGSPPGEAPSPDRPEPEFWGHLRLRGRIGSGGFGDVYRAWDGRLEREVALKLLRSARRNDELVQEGRMLARVRHPNVVAVYGANEIGGQVGVWMELVRGQTLEAQLEERGPCSASEASLVGMELCRALAAVHHAGLVHGDVKTSNVMREDGGRIVLMDFGIGRNIGADANATPIRGTPLYMAPEVIEGSAPAPAADIYALGILIYRLVTRNHPWELATPAAMYASIKAGRLRHLVDLRPELPGRFAAAVEKALVYDPQHRHPSAGAMEAALQAALSGSERLPSVAVIGAATEEIAPAAAAEPTSNVTARQDSHAVQASGEPMADRIDRLGDLLAALGNHSAGGDAALATISSFLSIAERTASDLTSRLAATSQEPGLLAMTLSLGHLAREASARLRAWPEAEAAPFHKRLASGVMAPAEAAARKLRSDTGPQQVFSLFSEPPGTRDVAEVDDVLAGLAARDPIEVHEAVLAVASDPTPVLAALTAREEGEIEVAFETLWRHADVLLLEGRSRARPVFEAGLERAPSPSLRTRWARLLQLLRPPAGDPVEAARSVLAEASGDERPVLGRCLLLHPSSSCRTLGLSVVEPADCWELVIHPDTPVEWLLEVWRTFSSRLPAGLLKVFLVCVRDSLLRPGNADRVVSAVEMVQEFYEVDAFHERPFFEMLNELDAHLREESRHHHLRIDLDASYLERFRRFVSVGSRLEQPAEGWIQVPLPVQRRLARRGHFLEHFSCHPIDAIALECLPHILVRESATDFVGPFAVNARLLQELGREKRFFVREDARYALVANPKTPTNIAVTYLRTLRQDSLRKLAASRDCNGFSRNFARKLLGLQG